MSDRVQEGTDRLRRLVLAGFCPFCGRGPYKVPAMHTSKAHGIDRHQLRDIIGVTYRTSICDPSHAEDCAERPQMAKLTSNGGVPGQQRRFSKVAKDRLRALSHERAEQAHSESLDRDNRIVELIELGLLSYQQIADEVGVFVKTVSNVASRRNLPQRTVPPNRPQRLCSIDGCGRLHKGHGLCKMHLRRQEARQ